MEAGESSGGLMAVPTEPPYCLVYPNIYTTSVPAVDRNHFNVQGGPPRLHTHFCICCALLQHADLSEAHRQKYHGSHMVVQWSAIQTSAPRYYHAVQSPGTTHKSPHRETLPHGLSGGLPTRGQDFPRDAKRQSPVQQ